MRNLHTVTRPGLGAPCAHMAHTGRQGVELVHIRNTPPTPRPTLPGTPRLPEQTVAWFLSPEVSIQRKDVSLLRGRRGRHYTVFRGP